MSKITVKQATAIMNVSERSIYRAKIVSKLRPDLGNEIMAGRMSIDAAYGIATGRKRATSWDRLCKAFLNASDADRRLLIELIDQTANWQVAHDR